MLFDDPGGEGIPKLSRWFIRTAMIYLLASLVAGVLQMTSPSLGALLWPVYLHLFVLGWLTQLIFGVAFWMFPRRLAKAPHGSQRLGWTTYWLLNAGLILRAVGEPALTLGARTGWVLVIAALLQLGAGWTFVFNTWPRVKER
jgi:heme/copper-type cytochrome/quinol oxidase subunit 1